VFPSLSFSWKLLTRRQKLIYSVIVSLRLIVNFLDIAGLALLGFAAGIAANSLLQSGEESFLGFSLTGLEPKELVPLMALVLVFFVGKSVLAIFFQWATYRFLATIEVDRGTELIDYLFTGRLSRLHRFSRSEIQFAAGPSVKAVYSGLLGGFSTVVTEVALLLSIVVLFVLVDPLSALVIVTYFVVVVGLLQWIIATRYTRAGKRSVKGGIGANAVILEMVDNFREMAVAAKQPFFVKKFRRAKAVEAFSQATVKILNNLPRYVVETALVLGAFLFLGWQFYRGEVADALISLGVFLAGGTRMMGALIPLQGAINGLLVAVPQSEMARGLLGEMRGWRPAKSADRQRGVVKPEPRSRPVQKGYAVSISHLAFQHEGADKQTLADISVTLPAGSFSAIVGPSGAGKTTLVDVLLGLLPPDSGEVLIDGDSPLTVRARESGSIAYVPQRPGLIAGTIAENIALGVPATDIDRRLVQECIESSQLAAFVSELPEGIDTDLGKHAHALSGGQIQRMGLARALYTRPRLLVLDEATSALDAQTEADISESIRGLGKKTTVVVIAHRLSTIQHADCVFAMEDGRIIGSGTFREVRKSVPSIESYVQLMSFDEE
jgi:ATP-binding cassette subfamily C protein